MVNKKIKKVLHPEILECTRFTLDNNWIQIFTQCSVGKFPKGLTYGEGRMCFKKKNIQKQYIIPKEPEQMYKILIKIFRDELDLSSNFEDKRQTQLVEADKETVQPNCTLADIKDKNIRYRMFIDYSIHFQKLYNLTELQRQKLYALMCIAQLLKIIQLENITVKDYKIQSIDCIQYINNDFFLDVERARLSSSSRSRSKKSVEY